MSYESEGRWHVDKRIPIAFIAAIVVQTFIGGWFMATMNGRVEANSRMNNATVTRLALVETRQQSAEILANRLEERFVGFTYQLETMNETLRQLRVDLRQDREAQSRSGSER